MLASTHQALTGSVAAIMSVGGHAFASETSVILVGSASSLGLHANRPYSSEVQQPQQPAPSGRGPAGL